MTLAACGRIQAPRGFLPTPHEAGQDAFGGWIRVTYAAGEATLAMEGELIAVGQDSLWVMERNFVHAIAVAHLREARLTGFDSQPGHVVGYTALGVLTSLATGWYFVLAAPTWMLVGAIASHAQADVPVVRTTGDAVAALARYARFPQGLPAGLDVRTLRPKPASMREDP